MANLKNITDLPIIESADGVNLIVNDNGSAKQIAAGAVGAQADFNVTDENHPAFIKNKPAVMQSDWSVEDESSPAFIKNKPVEEWDIYIVAENIRYDEDDGQIWDFDIKKMAAYQEIRDMLHQGVIPKVRVIDKYNNVTRNNEEELSWEQLSQSGGTQFIFSVPDSEEQFITIYIWTFNNSFGIEMYPDGTVDVFLD